MSQFKSLPEYENFVYTLPQQYPFILHSTLIITPRGRYMAELTGELAFPNGHRLAMYERLTLDTGSLIIEGYSYEVLEGNDKKYWYDSQPHPKDSELAITHPHHKHIPPDIKHHRVPAPELNFTPPNLPFLLQEIKTTLLES